MHNTNVTFSERECKQMLMALSHKSSNFVLEKPKFTTLNYIRPVQFLNKFESFAKINQIPNEQY